MGTDFCFSKRSSCSKQSTNYLSSRLSWIKINIVRESTKKAEEEMREGRKERVGLILKFITKSGGGPTKKKQVEIQFKCALGDVVVHIHHQAAKRNHSLQ